MSDQKDHNEPKTRKELKKAKKEKVNGKTGKYSQKHIRITLNRLPTLKKID
jgi:hypothetical protein